jgi:hypothetical protein
MKRSELKRRTWITRRAPIRRGRRRSKYSKRKRDIPYIQFVKTLLCSVVEEWPNYPAKPTPCRGATEADHMGDRGITRKADDRTCAPMCTGHHGERHSHTGTFKYCTKEQLRGWKRRAIARTQTLWAERNGEVVS